MAERTSPSRDLVPARWLIAEEYKGQGALVVMRDGSFRLILRVGAVNPDTRDKAERDTIIRVWEQLLNSLPTDFALQVVSHSKRLDADSYLRQFEKTIYDRSAPEPLKRLAEDHRRHMEERITRQNLLQREFFFVLPFKGVSEPVGERVSDNLPGAALWRGLFQAAENREIAQPDSTDVAIARQQLELRATSITAALQRMGIQAERLNEHQVLDLLYELFNPVLAQRQRGSQVDTTLARLEPDYMPPPAPGDDGQRRRRRRE